MVLVGSSFILVAQSYLISLNNVRVDIEDELFDPLEVVICELFHVVMAGTINVIWRVLVLGRSVQFLRMVKRHDFVTLAMNNIDRALNIGHAVDVWELIERQGPTQVEDNSQCRHQA